jgi:hypothetical protein
MKCLDCKFFGIFSKQSANNNYSGLCRGLPPAIVLVEKDKYEYKLPITVESNYCSLFKEKEKVDNEK